MWTQVIFQIQIASQYCCRWYGWRIYIVHAYTMCVKLTPREARRLNLWNWNREEENFQRSLHVIRVHPHEQSRQVCDMAQVSLDGEIETVNPRTCTEGVSAGGEADKTCVSSGRQSPVNGCSTSCNCTKPPHDTWCLPSAVTCSSQRDLF